jgi:hypothetical protein
MSALSVEPPFSAFAGADGQPLDDGYIWIGTVNLNPITNPIVAYWDAALTITAVQPIRTSGGYPVYQGTPARIYVNNDYSIQVQNKNGSLVYSAPAATGKMASNLISYAPGPDSLLTATNVQDALDQLSDNENGSDYVGFLQSGTDAAQQTVQDKLRQYINILDFGADRSGNIAFDNTSALNNAIAAATASQNRTIYIPSGIYYFNTLPANIAGSVRIYGDDVSSTVLFRNFTATNNYDGLFNVRDGVGACVFENLTLADTATASGGCLLSFYKDVADNTLAGDFSKVVNCNFTTFGTNTHFAAIFIDGEKKTPLLGIRNILISGCSVFGGTNASIYCRVVAGLDVIGTATFAAGGTTGIIQITGTASKKSSNLNFVGYTFEGFNLSQCQLVNISSPACGAIASDATAENLTFIGTVNSIDNNIVRRHAISTNANALFSGVYVRDGGFAPPSGTANLYGLYLTADAGGFTHLDAVTSSTSIANFRMRNYNNGTYNNVIESTNAGAPRFVSLATTVNAANAHLDGSYILYYSSSSSRYKKDIESVDSQYSDNVFKLRPVWYRSKTEVDRADWSWYGLIAEEVAEIDPRLVHWKYDEYVEDKDGTSKPAEDAKLIPNGVQYDRIAVLLLDVIKKQEQRIAKLENAIDELKKEGGTNEQI